MADYASKNESNKTSFKLSPLAAPFIPSHMGVSSMTQHRDQNHETEVSNANNDNGASSIFRASRDLTSYKEEDFLLMNPRQLVDACLELAKRTLIAEGLRTTHRTLLTPHRSPQSFESSEGSVYESLGEGGFGEVTMAIGSLDKKSIAIKVVPIGSSSCNRFKREVRIHASLPDHPNLVQYFCSAIGPGKNPDSRIGYIHMELCNGGNLETFLCDTVGVKGDTERLERLKQSLGPFMDCATGLEVLHSIHIVHRDIKPANIFLVKHDQGCISAKLGDFGLSCRVEDKALPAGTKFFSSPDPQPDTSSDIYSLGCVLFSLICQTSHPFQLRHKMGSIDSLAKKWNWDFKSECISLLSQEWKTVLFDLVKQMTHSTPSNRRNLGDVKYIVNDLIKDLRDV